MKIAKIEIELHDSNEIIAEIEGKSYEQIAMLYNVFAAEPEFFRIVQRAVNVHLYNLKLNKKTKK